MTGDRLAEGGALGWTAGAMQQQDHAGGRGARHLDGRGTQMWQVEADGPRAQPDVGSAAQVVAEADAGREQQDAAGAKASPDLPPARAPTGEGHEGRLHQQFRIQDSE